MRYLICFLLLSPLFSTAQTNAEDIILSTSKSLSIRSSIDYQAVSRFKFFSSNDTSQFEGRVQLIKDVRDTIFGGYIKYATDDSTYKFYDLHGIYGVNKNKDTITRFAPHKGEYWAMTGNIRHRIVLNYFIEQERLKKNLNSKNTITLLADTIIHGHDCYKVLIEYPDNEEYSDTKMILCINKKDMMLIYKRHSIKYQGNYQYHSLLIKDYTFNNVNKSDFAIELTDREQVIDTYKRKKRKNDKPIAKGAKAPAITGVDPVNGMKELTPILKGKITILDFWYMSCPPCIKAIPELEKIYEEYSQDDLQIIGINSIDNNEKGLKRLPKFLSFNPIKYQVLMVDNDIKKAYHIPAWPTFYIIDQNGNIAYSQIGFLDDASKEMKNVIDELLK